MPRVPFQITVCIELHLTLIQAHLIPPSCCTPAAALQVMGLKLLFEELDRDKDGLLSLAELREGLERKGDVLQGALGTACPRDVLPGGGQRAIWHDKLMQQV